ncbi:hypothetical protein BO78DRAFT_158878 [Aspergillus sclerotiicarbonarius CBS 121057]|uniref:Secreted protein n=1 Tax=Aspergillus sclerotiicarbonarius (strain CBS 121057 / IBT 28362) TaxID=1448318 RepID=A0A319FEB3_ASPSB|nr:hypothetical protein BO78DRAFT_158878 [Aspergillus sclerotiicarbonarius CBS 121057]
MTHHPLDACAWFVLIHWIAMPARLKRTPCSLETDPRPQPSTSDVGSLVVKLYTGTGAYARYCGSMAGPELPPPKFSLSRGRV